MTIRMESQTDYDAVYEVVKTPWHPQQRQMEASRTKLPHCDEAMDAFVPELSLVAEKNGATVGHILFTKVRIGESIALALAPLCARPQHQF